MWRLSDRFPNVHTLKPARTERGTVVEALLGGKDVQAVLPMRFQKSLIFSSHACTDYFASEDAKL